MTVVTLTLVVRQQGRIPLRRNLPKGSQFHPQAVAEGVQGSLGCIIYRAEHIRDNLQTLASIDPREDKTNPSDGSNLHNRPLRLDKQRQKGLAHADDGEEIGLKGRAGFGYVDLHGRNRMVFQVSIPVAEA